MAFLLSFLLLAGAAYAQTSFTTTNYDVGADPHDMRTDDLNGDGRSDIVTADINANGVSVLLGEGSGSFGVARTYATGPAPVGVALQDTNGDGRLDIIVAHIGTGGGSGASIGVLLNLGDGTFGAPRLSSIGAGVAPNSLAVADFNKDGKADVAIATSGKDIRVLYGTGSGTFTGMQVTAASKFNTAPTRLNVGDFDRDGTADLVAAFCCDPESFAASIGALVFYRGQLSSGGIQFTERLAESTGDVWSLNTVNYNNDGYTDLTYSYVGCHTPCQGVALLINNGNWTFRGAGVDLNYVDFGPAHESTVADMNGDGRKDLLWAGIGQGESGETIPDYIGMALANADGSFGAVQKIAEVGHNGPYAIVTADFNRDSKVDVAVTTLTNDDVVVALSAGASTSCAAPTTNAVRICSPTDGATLPAGPVQVTAAASYSGGVRLMQVYIDGSKVYEQAGNSIDRGFDLTAGAHRITVQALSNSGTYVKSSVNITVGSGGSSGCAVPATNSVVICSPANGATVSSGFTLAGAARTPNGVSFMQVYIDGVKRFEYPGVSSFSTTVTASAGTHRITVQALDRVTGTWYRKTIYVTVQ